MEAFGGVAAGREGRREGGKGKERERGRDGGREGLHEDGGTESSFKLGP